MLSRVHMGRHGQSVYVYLLAATMCSYLIVYTTMYKLLA